MKNYSKGEKTRKEILEGARIIFNEKGIGVTIDTLAIEMELSKSRITNHFATKDSLFAALQKEYEERMNETLLQQQWKEEEGNFKYMARVISIVMDVQYEFRCGIAYVSMVTHTQKEIHDQINQNYQRNIARIKLRLEKMVSNDILIPDILLPEKFAVFILAYVNLLTTWVTNLELYDYKNGYKKMKHYYLAAAFQCYVPFLTATGQEEFNQVDFKKIAKNNKV